MKEQCSRSAGEGLDNNEAENHVLRVRLEDSIFAYRFLSTIEDIYMRENGQSGMPRISEKIIKANVLGRPSKWIDLELTDSDIDHFKMLMEQGKNNSSISAKGKKRIRLGEKRVLRIFEDGLRREDISKVKSTTLRITRTIINSLRQ